jgi:hypothetical protein
MPELANNQSTGPADNAQNESTSSHTGSPVHAASHVLSRMTKWALITLILSVLVTAVFFFMALNQPKSSSKSADLDPKITHNTSGIPKQLPCPSITPAASAAGTLLYQDTTSCFYFYFPANYREIEGNLVESHIVEEDSEKVDTKYIRILFSWNKITPQVFSYLDRAKAGEQLTDLTFLPDSKTYKVKNLTLGNARAVMYLVETYRNEETEEINSCRRYFVVETGNTISTIEDRLNVTPRENCKNVKRNYPKNTIDTMLQSLVVYR